jgi:glutamine synthetase
MHFDGSAIDGFSRPGERRARHARPQHLRAAAVGRRRELPRPACSATSTTSTAHPSRATPARCCAQPRPGPRAGLHVLRAPEMEFFYFDAGPTGSRPSRSTAGRTSTSPPPTSPATCASDHPHARGHGHPGRVLVPRGQPSQHEIDLRYTDALTMADNVMTLPAGGAGDRPGAPACTPRSCPSRSRACRARACTPTCRCSRATPTPSTTRATPTSCRRSAKGFIAGLLVHAPEITAITNQLVNSYKRLIPGFEAPVYVSVGPQQPLGAGAGAGHQEGKSSSDPHRVPGARPGLQPLPRLLGDARRRPEGDRGGLRAAAEASANLFELTDRGAGGRGHRAAAAVLAEALDEMERSELVAEALGEHIFEWFLRNKRAEWADYKTRSRRSSSTGT